MEQDFRFGRFRLDPNERRLFKDGTFTPLEPKAFDVLLMLVRDSPHLVPREKFFAQLWPGIDAQRQANLLNQAVFLVRKAVDDLEGPKRFVITRYKSGYEFVAAVSRGGPSTVFPTVRPTTEIPREVSLSTKKPNPQWADFRDLEIPHRAPWVLKCKIATESRYFRAGFKLMAPGGRVFGDGSIQSQDANLVLHIGRNYWDRPGITKRDLFFTSYANGLRLASDRRLFRTSTRLEVSVELSVYRSYEVRLALDGAPCMSHVVPPEICGRVAILAWGDQDEFRVQVSELSVEKLKSQTSRD